MIINDATESVILNIILMFIAIFQLGKIFITTKSLVFFLEN